MSGKAKDGADPYSKASTVSSGASSNGKALSKPTPRLPRSQLKEKGKDTVVQDIRRLRLRWTNPPERFA